MRTLGEMADRSDRREDKPITCLGVRTRPTDWLLTRGFLFGQEIPGSTRAQPLHSQAGDTTAVLTLCHERINTHRNRSQTRTLQEIQRVSSHLDSEVDTP